MLRQEETRKSLNILVCFKVQPDFEHVLESDWEFFSPGLDISYARHSLNCFDESSLEIGLRLKESMENSGLKPICRAVTLAPSLQPAICKNLFAAGVDDVLRIDACLEFSPQETGWLLAAHLAAQKPDLILMGKQAGYADTGTVPYYVAERLGFPILTGVENITWENGKLTVLQICGCTRQKLTVRLPMAAVIGNSPVAVLRASTLRRQLESRKRQVIVFQEDTPLAAKPVLTYKRPQKNTQFLDASDINTLWGILQKEGYV